MAHGNKDLSKLLRLVADVSDSDQPELISYVYNAARSARSDFGKRKKMGTEQSEKLRPISTEDIVKLEKFESREELGLYLKTRYPRKSDVESVARGLEISISKTSNYEEIVDKIIDASIGYKLRSRAIRGE